MGVNAEDLQGISEMIQTSLSTVDPDARVALLNNVVVTGGSTLFPAFAERLTTELYRMNPGVCHVISMC
jgi:actin-related protein 4